MSKFLSQFSARWKTWRAGTGARPYVVLVCLSGFAFAETPQDLFKSANTLYAEGKFADAAQTYQAAMDGGLRHWALDYNAGNAYYRSGQLGRAVLHYERAFRLNSGQGDVLYNLNLAATKAGDPVLPSTALAALAWRLFHFLSVNTLTVLASLLFLALAAAGGAGLAGIRPLRGEWMAGLGVTFLLAAGWLGVRIYRLEKPIGVVVASVAEVRSGPNTTYPANFTVPEGRRVLILEEQEPIEGWLEIGVPQEGLKGWVPSGTVETI